MKTQVQLVSQALSQKVDALLLRSGRVVDPQNGMDMQADLAIDQGKIVGIGATVPTDFQPQLILSAKGHVICPGLIDLRACAFSPEERPTRLALIRMGQAALRAGITTLVHYPTPACTADDWLSLQDNDLASDQAMVLPRCFFLGALTAGQANQTLGMLSCLAHPDCVGLYFASYPRVDARFLHAALAQAGTRLKQTGKRLFCDALDPDWAGGSGVHAGPIAEQLGLPTLPVVAESLAVNQLLLLARQSQVPLHISRVSSAQALADILHAKAAYPAWALSADVTLHHLHLTERAIANFNPTGHVMPPLRTEKDRQALREALYEEQGLGVCTDHVPLCDEQRLRPMMQTVAGISGFFGFLPLTLQLAKAQNRQISLLSALSWVTSRPASLLGITGGALRVGACADICIFDEKQLWSVMHDSPLRDACSMASSLQTPFYDWPLTGKAVAVLRGSHFVTLT